MEGYRIECFQPTYKELKQYLNPELSERDIGFQPTYKELKRQMQEDK